MTRVRLQGGPYDGNLAVPCARDPWETLTEKHPKDLVHHEGAWHYRRTKKRDPEGHRIYASR